MNLTRNPDVRFNKLEFWTFLELELELEFLLNLLFGKSPEHLIINYYLENVLLSSNLWKISKKPITINPSIICA